jgi:lysophospholipase L1-like esterase
VRPCETIRFATWILLSLVLSGWAIPNSEIGVVTNKYTAEVAKFAALPAPQPGGVVLVGSSNFRKWTNVVTDLAPLPVTNRAFGGSQTSHQLMFFDQVVPPCRPALIVWYCGSNDIKAKKDAASILGRTEGWIIRVKQMDPSVGVLLVSVIRAPQKHRDNQIDTVDAVNRGYEEIARTKDGVFYVDVNPALQNSVGDSRAELYVEDGLHLNVEGYHQMATLLKPAIEKVWGKKPNQ